MMTFGQRFVVDTNALSQLGLQRRASAFFVEKTVIPEEVAYESAGFPDIEALRRNIARTSPSTLRWLTKIMSTVDPDDIRLINLYANLGNADPLVVACALDGREQDSQVLLPSEWVVVTGDAAVRAIAEAFNLRVLSSLDFAREIDTVADGGST